ncbi:MAG: peptidase M64 [Bacteroidales bacterium]|nr:peptidase M64 [Bacteroidales bacterium]
MKRFLTASVFLLLCACFLAPGATPGRTLRIDYIFSGSAQGSSIAVDELRSLEGWAGRTVNMDKVPLRGNGQICMKAADGRVLYRNSFSTLFQEWLATEEALSVSRSFQNVFLLPMPGEPVLVTVELYDNHGLPLASLTHPVNPSDILVRPAEARPSGVKDILINGPVDKCIDVVIVAEGYTATEMDRFYEDAATAVESILSHEPFGRLSGRFNFRAVGLESPVSGVSVPRQGLWLDTPLHSHFDTFYSARYLTTLHVKDLHDALAGVPYEHIIILANTDTYGGGGIFNSYTLTTAHHPLFKPVVVHEFGHSFAGLADEYYYDDQFSDTYYPDYEPWEQNITTKADFASKWEDMVGKDGVGLYEGGGYKSKGVWRGARDCRMKTNTAKSFCPVCQRAIERIISFYTE